MMALESDAASLAQGLERESAPAVTRRLGTVVAGTYRILRHIASGGSSHVFEAKHVRLGKSFAVKLLRIELDPSPRTARRFRREARAIANVPNEHIVSVIDCGELEDATPYLVMELLPGEDLRALLDREGALPLLRALHLVLDASRGVAAAHAANLVHRDLKPENLFVSQRCSGEDWCRVLDFGVAKTDASVCTAEGAIVGTVRYMSPEQLAAGETVGPASDVYALGAILYECLTGRALVSGETMQESMYAILNTAPRALRSLCPELPASTLRLVEACTEKMPSKRPANAAVLVELLQRALNAPQSYPRDMTLVEGDAAPESPLALPRRRGTRRARLLAAAASLAGVAVVLMLANARPRAPGSAAATVIAEAARPQLRSRLDDVDSSASLGRVDADASPSDGVPRIAATAPEVTSAKVTRRASAPTARSAASVGHFDATNPYE